MGGLHSGEFFLAGGAFDATGQCRPPAMISEADIARRWTLTGLADELHVAPGYLVRLFRAATGAAHLYHGGTPSSQPS